MSGPPEVLVTAWQHWYDGGCESSDYGFFYYLVNYSRKCGEALYRSQAWNYDYLSWSGWSFRQNILTFCLYGDPSLGTATVVPPPDISVYPDSFDVTLPPNATWDDTIEIGNHGDTTLTYELSEAMLTEGVYDDGTDESMICWVEPGNDGYAVRFTPPSYPVDLETARICLWDKGPGYGHKQFAVEVYDDDGGSGAPGTQLGTTVYTTSTHWGWVDVDISELGITVTSGDFYILYKQLSGVSDCERLCLDESGPDYGRSWDYSNGAWFLQTGQFGNYMIRCVAEVPENRPWLDESPKSGLVEPGNSDFISVTIDTADIAHGDYSAEIVILNNDPNNNPITVPITLHVSVANNTHQLSNPSVQPTSGTPSTDFYYYVHYYDSDGDSPSIKRVYIDGTPYTMSLQSGSASNGVYRYGPKNLLVGSHSYYFYFEDGKGATARLPTSGSYSGPVVSQTNNLPNIPSNPSPANHTADVSSNADLSWTGGDPDAGDTVTYYVYFGADSTPPLEETIGPYPATQTSMAYGLGTLAYDTTYYWRILARDNQDRDTMGPLWDFTTTSQFDGNPDVATGLASIEDELVMVYSYKAGEGVGGWTVYNPEWAVTHPEWNSLTTLYVQRGYWLNVSGVCDLVYGTSTYHLDEGWNLIGWVGSQTEQYRR